jgi:hypothetical protein
VSAIKKANVTWLVDGNNYVCWEQRAKIPTCNALADFVGRIDDWLDYERRVRAREIEVYAVFDPGAHTCNLGSSVAHVVIAPHGKRADRQILEIARRLKSQNPQHVVRVVSNDQRDEFSVLTREGFERVSNSDFEKKLDLGSSWTIEKDAVILQELLVEEKPDFSATDEHTGAAEASACERHINRLRTSRVSMRKGAASALGHFADGRALTALTDSAAKDPSPKVRKRALESLVQLFTDYVWELGSYRWHLEGILHSILENETDEEMKGLAASILEALEQSGYPA